MFADLWIKEIFYSPSGRRFTSEWDIPCAWLRLLEAPYRENHTPAALPVSAISGSNVAHRGPGGWNGAVNCWIWMLKAWLSSEVLLSPSLRWPCEGSQRLIWLFGKRQDSTSWPVFPAELWLVVWRRRERWSCKPPPGLSEVRQRHSLIFVEKQAMSTFLTEVQMLGTHLRYILTPLLLWKAGLHFADQVEELFVLCGEVGLQEALVAQKDAAVGLRLPRVDEEPLGYLPLPLQCLTLFSSHRWT